ncbi:MAG: hypothetical protein IKD69_15805, partial [Solobacterium sp.]|nr:hypothetical protein [Solobacterium sp.]
SCSGSTVILLIGTPPFTLLSFKRIANKTKVFARNRRFSQRKSGNSENRYIIFNNAVKYI